MDVIKIILTSLLSIAAMFFITKLLGHKQVAQLDFFDYVNGITIGSIAAELATDIDAPWQSLIALLVYGAFTLVLNLVTKKFMRTRKYINGTPTVLMSEGRLHRSNMKRAKIDLSEFMLLCREQGYFDISDISVATFEHNGKLSVLPKDSRRPLTPEDLNVKTKEAGIGYELIMDGEIIGENLTRVGRDERWLSTELKKRGCRGACDVFLAIMYPKSDDLQVYLME